MRLHLYYLVVASVAYCTGAEMSSYSLDTQERPGKMDDRKTTNEEKVDDK